MPNHRLGYSQLTPGTIAENTTKPMLKPSDSPNTASRIQRPQKTKKPINPASENRVGLRGSAAFVWDGSSAMEALYANP